MDIKTDFFTKKSRKKLTPKSFLYKNVYEIVPVIKGKKKKISQDLFEILKFNEYQKIEKINFNVKQLKLICGKYKLKKSGDKKELIFRAYNYLKFSHFSIKIQKIYRGYLRRKINKLRGPSFYSRKCTNETDFLTLTPLKNLNQEQFFSYKDIDGFVYGFDIRSLHNLCLSCDKVSNPYNRNLIPKKVKNNLLNLIKLSKTMNENLIIEIKDEVEKMSIKKKVELKTLKVFQDIDVHGFTTDTCWFLDLNRHRLIKYLKELIDIWEYRANLIQEVKAKICPPNGRPFLGLNVFNMELHDDSRLKLAILKIIDKFITSGVSKSDRSLGAYYVLGTFTIVSQDARNALPWMYESFMINSH